MHSLEIEDYKYKVRIYFNALGCIAALVLASIQALREDYATAFISIIGSIYFLTVILF